MGSSAVDSEWPSLPGVQGVLDPLKATLYGAQAADTGGVGGPNYESRYRAPGSVLCQ